MAKTQMEIEKKFPRILFITARSDLGGGPQHLFDLCSELKTQHPECFFAIAAADEEPFAQRYKELAHDFIALPKRSFKLKSFKELLFFCRKNKINLIHSHGRGGGIYARLLALIGGISVIHTFHGIHIPKTPLGILKLFIDYCFIPLTKHFICVSQDEQIKVKELHLAPLKKVSVILNGVDLKKIDLCPNSPKTSTIKIGTLARFNYQKGLDLQLKILSSFIQKFPEFDLEVLITGNGEDWQKTIEQHKTLPFSLSQKIKLIGPTNSPLNFLKQLDFYISFSRWEGLPLSVLEAMGSRLPCLLSNVTGHRDLAKDKAVILFELNDPLDFEKKFLALLKNPDEAKNLGLKARLDVERKFTRQLMGTKTFELYQIMELTN